MSWARLDVLWFECLKFLHKSLYANLNYFGSSFLSKQDEQTPQKEGVSQSSRCRLRSFWAILSSIASHGVQQQQFLQRQNIQERSEMEQCGETHPKPQDYFASNAGQTTAPKAHGPPPHWMEPPKWDGLASWSHRQRGPDTACSDLPVTQP